MNKLEELKQKGIITSFELLNLDDEGNVGESSHRNTEQLILTFPIGDTLTIDTFCSGSSEDTTLSFS